MKGHIGVLLNEQDGHALAIDLLDDVEDALHYQRGEAERRLIHHHELGPGHQGPPHRQHLLLTARERASRLPGALLEPGKEIVDPGEVVLQAVLAEIGPDFQVLQHREVGKDPPPFRHQGNALGHDAIRREGGDVLRLEVDAARGGLYQSGNGPQGGGLARAVGTDEGDDFPLRHLKGDVLDGFDAAVIDPQAVNLQHRLPPPNTLQ